MSSPAIPAEVIDKLNENDPGLALDRHLDRAAANAHHGAGLSPTGDTAPTGHAADVARVHHLDDDARALLGLRPVAEVCAEVDAMPPPLWLWRGVWPSDAHGVLAAKWKAGKTWVSLDAAIAAASGSPWLGTFHTDTTGTVLVFLGEGGIRKMTRRGRAVAAHYGKCWDDLPIYLSERVPHLSDEEHLVALEVELARLRPVLVIIDPLYLAAGGADASKLYEMGRVLAPVQQIAQAAGTALMLVHHNNRGDKKGSDAMSGAGPAEWGRVLVALERQTERVDGNVGDAIVTLDVEGDEVLGTHHRFRRRIWSDDPDDLGSPMHYEVTLADDATDDDESSFTPATRRVLDVLVKAADWRKVRAIGDDLADDGHPLKPRTIQTSLKDLEAEGLVERHDPGAGLPADWRAVTPKPPLTLVEGVTE